MYDAPVIGIELYRSDVRVIRRGCAPESVTETRSEITEFSRKSRQRLAFVANNTDVVFTSMLTLTYPSTFPTDGLKVKRDLHHLLILLRRRWPRLSYLWFLEFQRRGAPHIHILLTSIRVARSSQHWMSDTWYRVVDSGDPLHLRAGTNFERIRKRDGARHYAVKYASKMRQKVVPADYRNVGRFWGCSRDVPPQPRGFVPMTHDDLVGELLSIRWQWLKGETISYSVLYNVAPNLTERLNGAILGPSPSKADEDRGESLHEGR